jgi:uncharacterized alkaline shock family protein YloU
MVKFHNKNGFIQLSREIFTNLTGDAATHCFGVKGMTVRSVSDGIVHLLKREYMGKGVRVTYHPDNSISIDLHIAVERGVNIPVVCESIKDEVRYKVTKATGVELKRINIFVDSMMLS